VFGKGSIKEQISNEGNRFIVAHNRTQPLDSFSQMVQLQKGMLYTFSGSFTFSILYLYHISFTKIHLRNVLTWWHHFSETFRMIVFLPFPYSAWFQVSEGSDTVSVMFRTKESELVRGGQVIAKHGCWTLLKGGIAANFSSPVEILFEVKNTF